MRHAHNLFLLLVISFVSVFPTTSRAAEPSLWMNNVKPHQAVAQELGAQGVRVVIDLNTFQQSDIRRLLRQHASNRLGLCLCVRWGADGDATDSMANPDVASQRARLFAGALNNTNAKGLGDRLWIQFYDRVDQITSQDAATAFSFATSLTERLRMQLPSAQIAGPGFTFDDDAANSAPSSTFATALAWSVESADAIDVRLHGTDPEHARRSLSNAAQVISSSSRQSQPALVSWSWYPRDASEMSAVWQQMVNAGVRVAAYGPFAAAVANDAASQDAALVDSTGSPRQPWYNAASTVATTEFAEAAPRIDEPSEPDPAYVQETTETESQFDESSLSNTSTRLGLHAAFNLEMLQDVGVETARILLSANQIEAASNQTRRGGTPEFVQKLKQMDQRGIETIISVRWPESGRGNNESKFDGVPRDANEQRRKLTLFRRFLEEAGPYIDWVSLGNEVVTGGPGVYKGSNREFNRQLGAIPAIAWFEALAEEAKKVRDSGPRYAHLKIMSPGLTSAPVKNLAEGSLRNRTDADFVNAIIDFANQHCDALDIHLHVTTLKELETVVDFLREKSTVPLTTTEWSQAKAAKEWLSRTVADTGKYGNVRNGDVIKKAYTNKMSRAEWERFITKVPYDPTFLGKSFAILDEAGFVHACYGGGFQFGNPLFDWKAVYVTKTVDTRGGSVLVPNKLIYEPLKRLAEQVSP